MIDAFIKETYVVETGKKTVRAVIGTAGHVDHGKTTLVGALTGIETDRLKQEKDRGISIELGFAYLDGPAGRLGIVDVPGHERFVRQMIAGAAGIDWVMLIVAADEGVMPQTLEHLDICTLLGVRRGAVVLTKTDLVDDEWLELVADDVQSHVEGTFLEGAPVLHFTASKPESAVELSEAIHRLIDQEVFAERSDDRPFKLSIDRVFTMRGFGTVVTGTSASGELRVGDAVRVLPQEQEARVRGIQVHGAAVDKVSPGTRAAINIQGIDHDAVHRGDVLTESDGLIKTSSFDGHLKALKRLSKPIKDRAKVLVHVGTAQIQGKVILIGSEALEPGDSCPVQVRLDHPTAILPGEPFVIRGFEVFESYGKTLGGGLAMTPSLRPLRRRSSDGGALVRGLGTQDDGAIVRAFADFVGAEGFSQKDLPARLPLTRQKIQTTLDRLIASGDLIGSAKSLFPKSHIEATRELAISQLEEFHQMNPARRGMAQEELKSRLGAQIPSDVFGLLLQDLVSEDKVVRDEQLVAIRGFEPVLTPEQQSRCEKVLSLLNGAGLTPPRVQDLPEMLELSEADIADTLDLLQDDKKVARVSRELAYGHEPLGQLKEQLVARLKRDGSIDTADLKEMTGASRKWTIPLGEYFDRIKLTIRVGDQRRLRET